MKPLLQQLLDEGVQSGVFPMAQAVVIHDGMVVFEGLAGGATSQTQFDLASLTKVMSTTALFMKAWGTGALGPLTAVARHLPTAKSAEANVTVADLLCHRSGLPAFVPYFARVMPAVPELFDEHTPRAVWDEVRKEILAVVMSAALRKAPGVEAVYSDVGFIQLGELLSLALGGPLDELFERHIATPLKLSARFRRLSSHHSDPGDFAPTGPVRPREPAPGQETLWTPFPPHPSRPGEVDDDNAWVLDGVAGHAGLFGTAHDVAAYGQAVLAELAGANLLAPAPLWSLAMDRDTATPGSSRALGFDTPDAQSSAGRLLGNTAPGAVGHLGFTGTSLWIDRGRGVVVALLTNRVALGRGNILIRQFRPRFHDAVIESL